CHVAVRRFNSLKEHLDLRKHEVELVRQKLQQTSHHRYQEEVDNLKESIAKLGEKVVECTNSVADNQHKVNDLEAKLKNVKALKETQLQTAKNEMVRLEKKAEESSKQWKQREQSHHFELGKEAGENEKLVGGRPKMTADNIQGVKKRLLASSTKSLRRLSQERKCTSYNHLIC
ncbi:unnamed protein product, partial [Timema podura]|nr:unnamed protein product [Timema podura]